MLWGQGFGQASARRGRAQARRAKPEKRCETEACRWRLRSLDRRNRLMPQSFRAVISGVSGIVSGYPKQLWDKTYAGETAA